MLLGVGLLIFGSHRISGMSLRRVAVIVMLYPYTFLVLAFGSITTFVAGLCAAALALPGNAAVFAFGLAAGLKVTPLWAFGVLLVRERAWKGAVAVAIFGLGVCVAALGIPGLVREMAVFLTRIVPTLGQGQFGANEVFVGPWRGTDVGWVTGGTFLSFSHRCIGWSRNNPGPSPDGPRCT